MPHDARPDRLLTRTLQRALDRGMREHPERLESAGGPPEVRLVGLDPRRVLLIGSGVAIGLGVRTHDEALTGAIAAAVQARTGRGVIVQNRAALSQPVERTVELLGTLGAATFDTVVWCPSLFDAFRNPGRGRYHRALAAGIRLLRDTAPDDADIVVMALPASSNAGPLEEIARTLVRRYNGALRRAVAPLPRVRVVDAPPFTTLADPSAFSAAYYARCAALVVGPAEVAAHTA